MAAINTGNLNPTYRFLRRALLRVDSRYIIGWELLMGECSFPDPSSKLTADLCGENMHLLVTMPCKCHGAGSQA